jgi:hypothetical protein
MVCFERVAADPQGIIEERGGIKIEDLDECFLVHLSGSIQQITVRFHWNYSHGTTPETTGT